MPGPRSGTILILEDDPGVAQLTAASAGAGWVHGLSAGTAGEALARIRRGGVSLLVLDYQLPDTVNGLAFYEQLKAEGHDLPVILVTGFSDDTIVIRALRAGGARLRHQVAGTTSTTCRKPPTASSSRSTLRNCWPVSSARRWTASSQSAPTAGSPSQPGGGAGVRLPGRGGGRPTDHPLPARRAVEAGGGGSVSQWQRHAGDARRPGPTAKSSRWKPRWPASKCRADGRHLIVRDITARRRAEEALRESNRGLAQALAELRRKSEELQAMTQQLWQCGQAGHARRAGRQHRPTS